MVVFDKIVIEFLNGQLDTYTGDVKGLMLELTKGCNGVGFVLPVETYTKLLRHCDFPREAADYTNNWVFKFGNYLICEGSDFVPEKEIENVECECVTNRALVYILKVMVSRLDHKCESVEYENTKLNAQLASKGWWIFK